MRANRDVVGSRPPDRPRRGDHAPRVPGSLKQVHSTPPRLVLHPALSEAAPLKMPVSERMQDSPIGGVLLLYAYCSSQGVATASLQEHPRRPC
jgi:hypothetical protein